jgi:hypothetical protein
VTVTQTPVPPLAALAAKCARQDTSGRIDTDARQQPLRKDEARRRRDPEKIPDVR